MSGDTVVVIDDDPDFRELIEFIGKGMGFEVIGAPDCQKGYALVEAHKEALRIILVDYLMPGMAPCECISALIGAVGDRVPIVLVTAAVDVVERANELGLTRFLAKPFRLSELRRILLDHDPGVDFLA